MEESLAELIKNAVVEGIKEGLSDGNWQSSEGKDPYELLTMEMVSKEFDIGITKVCRMFRDPELAVQRYTKPFKVTRRAVQEYTTVKHDYLCGKEELK